MYQDFGQGSPSSASTANGCHALDWLEGLSTYYANLFSCGSNSKEEYSRQTCDLEDDDMDMNSIMVQPSDSIFVATTPKARQQYPGLSLAHSIQSESAKSKKSKSQAKSQSPAPRQSSPAKSPSSSPVLFHFADAMQKPELKTPDLQFDEELTTATTASMHSIASWNTTPTARDTMSMESMSMLEGLDFVSHTASRDDSWAFADSQPLSLSPSYLRRCTSDPKQAEVHNVSQVQRSVFPSLHKAKPVMSSSGSGQ